MRIFNQVMIVVIFSLVGGAAAQSIEQDPIVGAIIAFGVFLVLRISVTILRRFTS